MANLEVIALDTATPQLKAPQAGDGYAMPRPVTVTEVVGSTALTLTGATQTTAVPVLNATQTWNNAATTFTAAKINVTDTASNAASNLLDLQVGGTSQLFVGKDGRFGKSTAAYWIYSLFAMRWVYNSTEIAGLTDGFIIYNNKSFRFDSSNGTGDLFLTRKAAASLQLGAADAAAPVAQTIGPQSVVAGTSNTAGQNFTVRGSQGTGTGAGGSILFQTAPAGSAGTAQNALVTQVTVAGSGGTTLTEVVGASALTLTGATQTTAIPVLNATQTWNNAATTFTGIKLNVTDTTSAAASLLMDAQVGGTSKFSVRKDGRVFVSSLQDNSGFFGANSNYLYVASSGVVSFSGATNSGTSLREDGVQNILAQRNSTNAQTFRVYNTYTSATSYERIGLTWTSNVAYLAPEKGSGGGSDRLLVVSTGATTVAGLPSAATAGAGARSFVTDALATVFLSTVAGGGANSVPVVSDGTNWLIG
jgi:hypothetical protein